MSQSHPSAPAAPVIDAPTDIPAARRLWVFVAALVAVFISAIEVTIVATAMPSIVGALGDFELFSWVFTAYLLIQAATIPIYGRLSDLYGRKPVLLIGLAIFLVGSALCGLATNMTALIVFRVVQGLGAGGIQPVAQTLIGDLFRGADRARKQAYVSATFGSAALLGPVVGAFLVAHTSWPMVFWINVPLGLIGAVILIVSLRETVERRQHRIDYVGSLLMIVGTTALMFALAQGSSLSARWLAFLAAVTVGALAALFIHQRRTPEPMLPLKLWRNPFVAGGNVVNLAIGAVLIGIAGFLPAYIQGVMGYSAFVAGFALSAVSGGWPLGGFFSGQIMLRSSYRTAGITGSSIMVTGSVLMVALDPSRGAAWAIAGATVVGFGMGLSNNCFLVALQANTGWAERGAATSSTMFMRIMGQTIGAALFGGILNAALAGHGTGATELVNRLMDPALRRTIATSDLQPLTDVFATALHHVYWISLALAVVVFVTACRLPAGARFHNER